MGQHAGNHATHSFVTSPEIVAAFAYSGSLSFNPVTDTLPTPLGKRFRFNRAVGDEIPTSFVPGKDRYQAPPPPGTAPEVKINPNSDRLQLLTPFEAWKKDDAKDMAILIKVKGKCTTDHISPAGPWYGYRGHLGNISRNLLTGAENAFLPDQPRGIVKDLVTGKLAPVPEAARNLQKTLIKWCIIGHNNYGEGSSREHAALEPRYLGATVTIANSFARIHETNLKKQGLLPLTFMDPEAFGRLEAEDRIDVEGVENIQPGKDLKMVVRRRDGAVWETEVRHSLSEEHVRWLLAGGALNYIRLLSVTKSL